MTQTRKNATPQFPVPVPTADHRTHDLLAEIQQTLTALELAQRLRYAIPRVCPKCGYLGDTIHTYHPEATP